MYKQVLKQAHINNGLSSSLVVSEQRRSKSLAFSPWDTPPLVVKPRTTIFSKNLKKKVLVLDLDETLLHCRMDQPKSGMRRVKLKSGDLVKYANVSLRPGVEKFLEEMSKYYVLAIYTTGLKDYADSLLRETNLKKYFKASLYRNCCKQEEDGRFVKNLAIFGVPMKDIILIDDSLVHYENQPNNFLQIKRFTGDLEDKELERLVTFLKKLAEDDDVRPVAEKYSNFFGKQPLMTNQSTALSTSNESFSQGELMISKEKSNKTVRDVLSESCSFFKESADLKIEDYACNVDSMNLDENLDENLESRDVFRGDGGSSIFEIIKSKSEPNPRRNYSHEKTRDETPSPNIRLTKLQGSESGGSPLVNSDDNVNFDTSEVLFSELEAIEQVPVSRVKKPIGSMFKKMKKTIAIVLD